MPIHQERTLDPSNTLRTTRSHQSLGARLAGLLLVLGMALGAQAEPPSSKVPGRPVDSREPWGAFLGRTAHFVIGKQYIAQHPGSPVFLGNVDLTTLMRNGALGDPERLPTFVRRLRPDITDTRALVLFEIKPDHEHGQKEGREQAGRYLAALNAAVNSDKKLSGGTGFEGALFLEFENGGVLWQLSWRTPEPGVTLYRWSRRREKPHTSWKERAAQKEEALSKKEADQSGELAEQSIRAAYGQGNWPDDFRGQVYLPVECR